MLATAQLVLRPDLIVSRQELPGGPVFIVKDPAVARFVRLKETENFIARQFDGLTAPEEIRRRSEEHLDASLSLATLEQFASRLQNLGLLVRANGQTGLASAPSQAARVGGNALYIRFKLFDPDQFLDRIV